jgi:hypothetical protein
LAPEPQRDEAPMAPALNLIIKNVTNYKVQYNSFLLFPQDKILSYSHMCLLLLALKKSNCYKITVVGLEPEPHRNFYLELEPINMMWLCNTIFWVFIGVAIFSSK